MLTSAGRPPDTLSMSESASPKITVLYLLYNAERTVGSLVESIRRQRHPDYPRQEDWFEVIFMDDGSSDRTLELLEQALERIGRPAHYRVLANRENLGLARTLNIAFQSVRSPYGLSCHCDVFFGTDTYVASMLELMDRYPAAGAITGKPQIDRQAKIPFVEKVNLISNLMDILPAETEEELIPVGFAEGRCDVFRIEALQAVGFYSMSLRVAGEDQLLAARMRGTGFHLYQAPRLPYVLRASNEQDSITKLMKHEMRFGKVHPFIILRSRNTASGIVGSQAGQNRQARMFLRGWQVASSLGYLGSFAGFVGGAPLWSWLPPLVLIYGVKSWLFRRHVQAVPLSLREHVLLYAVQPLLDLAYTLGLVQGVWLMVRGSSERPIT